MENSAQTRPAASRRGQNSRSSAPWTRGSRSWSPFNSASSADPDEQRYWLEREITLLERALKDKGEMRRGDLGELVGCKYWGPRRFAGALRAAVDEGRIKRTGIGRYGPANS